MINDTKIDFRLTKVSDLDAFLTGLPAKHGHYKKLVSAISELDKRSDNFYIVMQIFDGDDTSEVNLPLHQLKAFMQALSKREMQVYALAIRGVSNKVIADELFVGLETVKSHRKNILRKAGVKRIDDIKNLILRANGLIG